MKAWVNWRVLQCLVAAGAMAVACGATSAAPPADGNHLAAARDLAASVDLAHTSYEHGQGTITWTGTPSSHTDCSGFVDHLLMHTYGYSSDDFKRWFDSRRPSAKRYYEAIVEQTGFVRLGRVTDLRPGDFIAVKYLDRADNTGHIMLVDQAPARAAGGKAEPFGTAWLVPIIDSSESGHGPTDTRHKRGADGHDHDGLGQGVLRLYADPQGRVTGFSWSTLANSAFRSPNEEPVALGRLVPGYRP